MKHLMEEQIQKLSERLSEMVDRIQGLQKENTAYQVMLRRPPPLENLVKASSDFSEKIGGGVKAIQAAVDESLAAIQAVKEELAKQPPSPVKADALMDQFRLVIEKAQLDARKPQAGEVSATLKSMDVEIKGLIAIDNKGNVGIVTPIPKYGVDPGQLSTIRMSFGTIPTLRSLDKEPVK